MSSLKRCPFCGKQVAIIDTCHELEDCANFERCGDGGYYSVVCNFNHGGCGGSAGYDRTELGAISRWNRRAQPGNATPTNADKIRSMSDEELAAYLRELECLERDDYCRNIPECDELLKTPDGIPEEKCRRCLVDWLRQPAKEEAE